MQPCRALLVNWQENLSIFCHTQPDTPRAQDEALPCSIANQVKMIRLGTSARGQLVFRLRPAKYQQAAPPCCLLYSSLPYFLSLSPSSHTPRRVVQRQRLALAHFNHGSLPLIHIPVAFITPALVQKLWQCWIRALLRKQSYTHHVHVCCLITLRSQHGRVRSVLRHKVIMHTHILVFVAL